LSYFDFINFSTVEYYSKKFETLFGISRKPNESLTQKHYDIASGLQAAVEERVLELLNHIGDKYPDEKNLCLSGGFFMNSVLNGKIHANTNFNDPHIGPCPDDTGISIGTAFVSASKKKNIPIQKYFENYFGSKFSNEEIKRDLDISKIKYEEISNYLEDAAKFLANGKIIGWFQGRSELGQRSLGNRSILASPTFSWMKDEINKFVKFREEFRPFAPSILEEYKEEYFEISSNTEVYFMEKVVKFKDSVIEKVPAVVHNDGTGRIHTVSEKSNKIFYDLLKEFYSLTEIPILLNTSFNTNNVPIVDSPKDALSVFYNCGLDVMYLNNIRIIK
jgi:carbamoyltransferase